MLATDPRTLFKNYFYSFILLFPKCFVVFLNLPISSVIWLHLFVAFSARSKTTKKNDKVSLLEHIYRDKTCLCFCFFGPAFPYILRWRVWDFDEEYPSYFARAS